jgi:hypothetical protein
MQVEHTPGQRKVSKWTTVTPTRTQQARTWLTNIAIYGPVALVITAMIAGLFSSTGWFFFDFLAAFVWMAIATSGLERINTARAQQEARSIREQVPDGVPAMEVRLTLLIDGHVYGGDVGVLARIDGWIVFEGSNTCFFLAPADLDDYQQLKPVKDLDRIEMTLDAMSAKVRVRFTALSSADNLDSLFSNYLSHPIADDAVSVLPPLEPRTDSGIWQTFPEPINSQGANVIARIFFISLSAQFAITVIGSYLKDRGYSQMQVFQVLTLTLIPYSVAWALWRSLRRRRAIRNLKSCRTALISKGERASAAQTLLSPLFTTSVPAVIAIESVVPVQLAEDA